MNDFFKEQNERIVKELTDLLTSHLPEDQLDIIIDYCSRNELEIDSVVKIIKKNTNLKSHLSKALIEVHAINHDSV